MFSSLEPAARSAFEPLACWVCSHVLQNSQISLVMLGLQYQRRMYSHVHSIVAYYLMGLNQYHGYQITISRNTYHVHVLYVLFISLGWLLPFFAASFSVLGDSSSCQSSSASILCCSLISQRCLLHLSSIACMAVISTTLSLIFCNHFWGRSSPSGSTFLSACTYSNVSCTSAAVSLL